MTTTTTTTTTTHVIIVTKKKIGILGKDQACLKAVARRRDHLKDNCTKVAFPVLLRCLNKACGTHLLG
jgi:hypothetical protein